MVAVDYNNDVLLGIFTHSLPYSLFIHSLDDVDDIVDDGDEKKAKRAKRNDALISKSYPAAAALAREINATLEFYLSSGLGCKQNEYGKAAVMVARTLTLLISGSLTYPLRLVQIMVLFLGFRSTLVSLNGRIVVFFGLT